MSMEQRADYARRLRAGLVQDAQPVPRTSRSRSASPAKKLATRPKRPKKISSTPSVVVATRHIPGGLTLAQQMGLAPATSKDKKTSGAVIAPNAVVQPMVSRNIPVITPGPAYHGLPPIAKTVATVLPPPPEVVPQPAETVQTPQQAEVSHLSTSLFDLPLLE